MLYNVIKNLISKNYYKREDMTNKLNVFMLVNQITEVQYLELIAIINPVKVEEKKEDVKVEEKPVDKVTEVKPVETANTTLDNSNKEEEEVKTEVVTQ